MDALEILVVPGVEYDVAVEQYLLSSVRALVGEDVRVELKRVADIPVPESGKRRYIVSSIGKVSAR